MKFFDQLFSKTPSEKDIRIHLKEIEREQIKRRRDLDVIERTKQEKIRQAVAAKNAGKQEIVREIYREMRQIEIDSGFIHSDLRRLSLSKTALTAFLRKMEMLQNKRDHRSTQNLITHFKNSDLQKVIDLASVDDESFNDLLGEILGDEELGATRTKTHEDPGFAEFDRAISEMAKTEDGEPLSQKAASPNTKDYGNNEEAVGIGGDLGRDLDKYYNKTLDEIDKPRYPTDLPDLSEEPGKLIDRPGDTTGSDTNIASKGVGTKGPEPLQSAFEGDDQTPPDGQAPPDDCAEFCVGGTATTEKVHG